MSEESMPQLEARAGRVPAPMTEPRTTVLVALKDRAQRKHVSMSLRTLGCRVVLAGLSRTAHQLERPQPSSRPTVALDAIVLDLSTQPTAGLAAFHAIRMTVATLPVIVLVARGDEPTRERALRLDPWVLLEAPVPDEVIVATVMRLAARPVRWRAPRALAAAGGAAQPGGSVDGGKTPPPDPRPLCA